MRPGQAGTRHSGPGEMLTGPCLVPSVDICSFEGRHLGISFLQHLRSRMLKTPYPQAVYLFVYSTNILSSGCARHCRRVPGDEAMNTSDPVRVLLELTVKQKRSLQWLLAFTVRTFMWILGTQLRHMAKSRGPQSQLSSFPGRVTLSESHLLRSEPQFL